VSGRQAIAYRRMRNAAAGEAARAGTRDPAKHNTSAPVETQSGHDRGLLSSPPTVRVFYKSRRNSGNRDAREWDRVGQGPEEILPDFLTCCKLKKRAAIRAPHTGAFKPCKHCKNF